MKIEVGIRDSDRKALAEELSVLLADSYTLNLKTQSFHWNVTGPMFETLHLMFEQQSKELAPAVDTIAERIRALGQAAPGSYSAYSRLARVSDTDGVPDATEMIRLLIEGHETVVRTARTVLTQAEKTGDQDTADLAIERLQAHEISAWILRGLLES